MAKDEASITLPKKTEAREAVVSMNDELREVYTELHERFSQLVNNDIKARYNIGKRIQILTENDADKKYGENSVERMAAGLGVSASGLYSLGLVAATWSKEEFEALLERKNTANRTITYSHLVVLVGANSSSITEKGMKAFYAEALSVRDLRDLVQELNGGKKSNYNPAKVLPKSAEAGLRSITSRIKKVQAAHETFEEAVFNRIDPSKDASEKLISILEDTRSDMEELIAALNLDSGKISETVTALKAEIEKEDIAEEKQERARTADSAKTRKTKRETSGITSKAKRGLKVKA